MTQDDLLLIHSDMEIASFYRQSLNPLPADDNPWDPSS